MRKRVIFEQPPFHQKSIFFNSVKKFLKIKGYIIIYINIEILTLAPPPDPLSYYYSLFLYYYPFATELSLWTRGEGGRERGSPKPEIYKKNKIIMYHFFNL